MDINKMTRKQFEALPYLKGNEYVAVDGVVLLPTRRKDSSGYRIFEVVVCNRFEPVGKLYGYDTFSIIMESNFNRVSVDCLIRSGLMRIFIPPEEYEICPMLHQATRKKELKSE